MLKVEVRGREIAVRSPCRATDIDAQLHFCPDNVGSSTLAWLKSALAAKIADAVGQGIKSGIETGGCRSTMQDAGTSDAQ